YVPEGMTALYRDLQASGIGTYGTGGVRQEGDAPVGAIFTHPRDTSPRSSSSPGPSQVSPRVARRNRPPGRSRGGARNGGEATTRRTCSTCPTPQSAF